ncbi:auxin-binding protein [Nitratireductor mangrovi]|uniref:Auxin-binding protein n=2 Tax=Nitratireductor mangrovi TaxID=2599600 RepID=A0A5B8L694_9HYPH|nr:auxin-binding protein [Nitratireductor mangrovi]
MRLCGRGKGPMVGAMFRIIAFVLSAAALAFAAIFLLNPGSEPAATRDLSRSKASDNGLYVVEIAPEKDPIEQGVLHGWVVTLTTPAGEAVEGAAIAVGGGMPDHGHGLPTSPEMTAELGEGRYQVEGVRFNMGGWWVLEFEIDAGPGKDSATFNLQL